MLALRAGTGGAAVRSRFDYPVSLAPDGTTLLVRFADVPEALTSGVGRDEALIHAAQALESALSFYVDAHKRLPVPSAPTPGLLTVRPSAMACAKLGIYVAMTEQGVTRKELARRMGAQVVQIIRMFDLRHETRMETLEAAALALGKRLEARLV